MDITSNCYKAFQDFLDVPGKLSGDIIKDMFEVFKAGWNARVEDKGLMAPAWRDKEESDVQDNK